MLDLCMETDGATLYWGSPLYYMMPTTFTSTHISNGYGITLDDISTKIDIIREFCDVYVFPKRSTQTSKVITWYSGERYYQNESSDKKNNTYKDIVKSIFITGLMLAYFGTRSLATA